MDDEDRALEAALAPARARARHIVLAIGALLVAIAIETVVSPLPGAPPIPDVLRCLTSFAAFALLGSRWYRGRMCAIDRLRQAVLTRAPIHRVRTAFGGLPFVQIGPQLAVDLPDADGDSFELSLGLWSSAAARLLHLLLGNPLVPVTPMPIAWRARYGRLLSHAPRS